MKYRTRDEHFFDPSPKRILALDGGGIRGALTLGYLARIENILRQRVGGDPDFRLCNYFDLIGGTSTGSIIATGLAMGFSVEKLQQLYLSLSNEVFKKPLLRLGVFSSKFPSEPLLEALSEFFGDNTLGSDKLRTGLMVMTKRLDTGSPWVLHNNPKGKYFNPRSTGGGIANRDYLLREIVRASTAAPHYFEPEEISVAQGVVGAFVDGGVSPYNNPTLQLLLLATLEGYGLKWPLGVDKLLVVSVGTGYREVRLEAKEVLEMPAIQLAAQSVLSIMGDCDWLGQTVLQWLSHSATPWKIDSEMGDLQSDVLSGGPELLTYLRYTLAYDSAWLKDNLNVDLAEEETASLFAMDNPKNVEKLSDLGAIAASVQVKEDHFPAIFDLYSTAS
ncbi:MAG: patatin-like phospholipase family protein [Anaerolineae bacterium]|nr:patatin-like phospholipase family protein [Anaerolineae bacterium]